MAKISEIQKKAELLNKIFLEVNSLTCGKEGMVEIREFYQSHLFSNDAEFRFMQLGWLLYSLV